VSEVSTIHNCCSRCGEKLFRATDGNWVNDREDVICHYGPYPREVLLHDPVEGTDNGKTDTDELVESSVPILAVDGGAIRGYRTHARVGTRIALFRVDDAGEHTVYLGTAEWHSNDEHGGPLWSVQGVGDLEDVRVTRALLPDAVGLLYTAYQVGALETTDERG
jgi:hypothetical protein